jgi:F-type H+-transporting ATPase subunit epsilon
VSEFRLEIVTPERRVFGESVRSLVAPAAGGYLGVLPGHAPLLARLMPGVLKVSSGSGTRRFATSGGFMEVTPRRTILLADAVEEVGEIDVKRAREAADRARRRLKDGASGRDIDLERAQAALARALNRIRAAGGAPGRC